MYLGIYFHYKLRNLKKIPIINLVCGKCYEGSSCLAERKLMFQSNLLKGSESAFMKVKENKRERFQAIKSVLIKIQVFFCITTCTLVNV
jgi:hypothetical protein